MAKVTAAEQLQKLIDSYNNAGYTAKTADQINAQAQGEYQSYYDQLRQAAEQSTARSDLALQQQREGLQSSYDKQREASRKEYEDAYSQIDRQHLQRGMQRSSYNAQTLANLRQQGAEAQQDLYTSQYSAEANIDAQRQQLADQLADKLAGYDAQQAADVLARVRELEDEEYDRGQEAGQYADSLGAQIYEYLLNAEQSAGSGGDGGDQKDVDAKGLIGAVVGDFNGWMSDMDKGLTNVVSNVSKRYFAQKNKTSTDTAESTTPVFNKNEKYTDPVLTGSAKDKLNSSSYNMYRDKTKFSQVKQTRR